MTLSRNIIIYSKKHVHINLIKETSYIYRLENWLKDERQTFKRDMIKKGNMSTINFPKM